MTEDGSGKLQVPPFPLATSYVEGGEALRPFAGCRSTTIGTVVVE